MGVVSGCELGPTGPESGLDPEEAPGGLSLFLREPAVKKVPSSIRWKNPNTLKVWFPDFNNINQTKGKKVPEKVVKPTMRVSAALPSLLSFRHD